MSDLEKKYHDIFFKGLNKLIPVTLDVPLVSLTPCFDQDGNLYVIKRTQSLECKSVNPSKFHSVERYSLILVESTENIVEAFPFIDKRGVFFLLTDGTLVIVHVEETKIIIKTDVKKIFPSELLVTIKDQIANVKSLLVEWRNSPVYFTISLLIDNVDRLVTNKGLVYALLNDGRLFICNTKASCSWENGVLIRTQKSRELFPEVRFRDLGFLFPESNWREPFTFYDDHELYLLGNDSVVYRLTFLKLHEESGIPQRRDVDSFWFNRKETSEFPYEIQQGSSLKGTFRVDSLIEEDVFLYKYQVEDPNRDGSAVKGLYGVSRIEKIGNGTIVLKLNGECWISRAVVEPSTPGTKGVYRKFGISVKDFIISRDVIYIFDNEGRSYTSDCEDRIRDTNLPSDIPLSATKSETRFARTKSSRMLS